MHLIDQELSGIDQLGAIVGAISGYLCSKQFGQLCRNSGQSVVKWHAKGRLGLQHMKIRQKQHCM